ncbi:MAG: cytochrome c [Alphaproteobacteria bacterium]
MMVRVASLLFTVALSSIAQAQQKAPPDLTPVQAEGRAIFSKSCTICHLPPQLGAGTFGPQLSKASLDGDVSVLREVISNGMPHMPGFKHMYQPAQIDSVIAYLKTVPAPAPAAPGAAR